MIRSKTKKHFVFCCKKKVKAYTLTEILVVLVIIGILVLLALPNLLPLITKAKSTEAKVQLQHVSSLQQTYFYEKSKYSTDLPEIGFIQEKLTTEGKVAGKVGDTLSKVGVTNSGRLSSTAKTVVRALGQNVTSYNRKRKSWIKSNYS